MNIDFFLQLTVNGLLLGGFYATMSLGFSIIWGVMGLINLAHGEFLMMGALIAWFFFNPQREQSLTVASSDSNITLIAFIATSAVIGLILSEFFFENIIKTTPSERRLSLMAITIIIGIAIYALWKENDFASFDVTTMALILGGLALSGGFIISHMFLNGIVGMESTLNRRLIGYGISGGLVIIGYLVWRESGFPSIDPFLSIPLLFILFFGLGYVLQKTLLNQLVEGPYLTMLLVTFSIAIILQNIGLSFYAGDPRRINVDYGPSLSFGSITVPQTKLFTVIISIGMIYALARFLNRTRIGYAIRAASQNKMAARLMGINIKETYAITFAISLAMTGIAGGMMGTFIPITPISGPPWTLRAFSIVALGGLGKIEGVVVGGFVLGLAESYIGGYINVGWAVAVAFLMLVITLIVRPQGLTGGLVPSE